MPVASTSSLTVRYGAKTAVDDLTVKFPEGCVGLLGANGAGKTTLLNTMLGFIRGSRGACTVLGLDAGTEPLRIRQRIGLMPEKDCHIPGLNAVSFVSYAGELCGMPGAQALRRAHEVLEYCGLGEARYRNVETYSTGMKQRIKLAQALVHGPSLLLLDEPTNGLDPEGRDHMLDLVRDVSHGKGVHVIVSSHILPDIERVCDSVVVMRSGKLAMEGAISDLRATEGRQFDVDLRFPTPAFLDMVIRGGGSVVHSVGSRCRISLDGAAVDTGQFIFEAAREAGAEVRGFQPAVRSLEDVFLEAVE
jgi:ABC-2 type transport system ATP-binding protein